MRYPGMFLCVLVIFLFWGGVGRLGAEKIRVERYDAAVVSGVSISGRFHKVEIVVVDQGPLKLEISGVTEGSEGVEAFLEDGVLLIRNADSHSIQRVDNSLNIAVGNSRSILTIGNKTLSSSTGDPKVIVTLHCPKVVDLHASGIFELQSSAPLNKVDLKLVSGGLAHIEKCGSEDVRVECVGDVSVGVFDVQHADVAIKAVGGGGATLKGSFRSVTVESVGANEIQTAGPVAETCSVSIIGSGSVTHTGRIAGRIDKFVTGKGRFVHVEE